MNSSKNLDSRVSDNQGLPASETFVAMPRNSDTAVVYWNVGGEDPVEDPATRLCLRINGQESDAEEFIFLHREAGHFIVPLLAEDRVYEINLGWSNAEGFSSLVSQTVELPDDPEKTEESLGAMSSSLSFRGAHFWPKNCDTSVN